jgi:predicted nucleotidyltransferase component of viral defense system
LRQEKPRNLAASIHQRLLTLARKTSDDFGFVLTRYALERLLYRLSRSRHADAFVLKGAILFQAWTSHPHRPTRDVDFLGRGEYSISRFKAIFSEIERLQLCRRGSDSGRQSHI